MTTRLTKGRLKVSIPETREELGKVAAYISSIDNYSWAFAENQYDYVGNAAGDYGYYWTSTVFDSRVWYVSVTGPTVEYSGMKDRSDGQSVRLVADVEE